MSDVLDWLEERRPTPPPDLAAALRVELGAGDLAPTLTEAALVRLGAVRERPGRVRDSAFRLLEADALLTYACEAALESEDPKGALRRILAAAGT